MTSIRDRITFYVHPFGRPFDGRYIVTHSVSSARDLAAFHFRIDRKYIKVRRADVYSI